MPNVYNKTEAAKALRVSPGTLNRYLNIGKLPHRKIGDRVVFTEGDLVAFLEACAVNATDIPSGREALEMGKRLAGGGDCK